MKDILLGSRQEAFKHSSRLLRAPGLAWSAQPKPNKAAMIILLLLFI